MNTLSVPESVFSKVRNSPLIFLPIVFIGIYALASLSYTLVMEREGFGKNNNHAIVADTQGSMPADVGFETPNLMLNKLPQAVADISVAPSDIYLFNSGSTRDYFASKGENYELILDQWHYYFADRGIKYVELKDENLKSGLKPGILILPSTVVLSVQEKAAIKDFEKRGGSVLATWAAGSRNGNGELPNYEFLHEQFGIRVSGEIAAQDKEKFLVVFGETPVAHSLPAGSRIWLGLENIHEHPLRVTGGENIAGRFMDGVRTPNRAAGNEAVVYTETGSSRRAFLAFSENSWRFEQKNIYTLLDDVFKWLHRSPDTYLASWPYPYRAAQILEMDTEQGFPNATRLAALLDSNGFKGTFYSLTSVARQYPDAVKQLETRHEIAYHGDVHNAFKGESRELQSERLDAMQRELRPLVNDPSKLTGFRPPYELSDQVVESLLFEKGFRHILPNSDTTNSMLPYLSLVSPADFQNGLIVLPRTQRDDMNFMKEKISSPDITREMEEDFDQTMEIAALGVLSVHSQNFEAGSEVTRSTAEFFAYIRSSGNKAWVAPSGAVESWWRERALFKSELTGSLQKMLLNVTIGQINRSAAIVILNPAKGLQPKISAAGSGANLPVLVPLDKYRTAIVFNALPPGNYRYSLSY
ncbi:MAG: polysaccharide deacetylase family protein [Proteobacteria bacterium]|nr:polysaccharide deacetylase family protein [Pseudomonadota bacterium]